MNHLTHILAAIARNDEAGKQFSGWLLDYTPTDLDRLQKYGDYMRDAGVWLEREIANPSPQAREMLAGLRMAAELARVNGEDDESTHRQTWSDGRVS